MLILKFKNTRNLSLSKTTVTKINICFFRFTRLTVRDPVAQAAVIRLLSSEWRHDLRLVLKPRGCFVTLCNMQFIWTTSTSARRRQPPLLTLTWFRFNKNQYHFSCRRERGSDSTLYDVEECCVTADEESYQTTETRNIHSRYNGTRDLHSNIL
jgi:hypothetical protein